MNFQKCADCWDGSNCHLTGRCLADDILQSVDAGPCARMTVAEMSAMIEAMRLELDKRSAQMDAWSAAAPKWIDLTPKPPRAANGGCSCCAPFDADEEARAEGFEPAPLLDYLIGDDAPTADEMLLDAAGDAISAVVNLLLLQGSTAEELIARLVGATKVHSITVNVDGDVSDGSSIADAIRRGL